MRNLLKVLTPLVDIFLRDKSSFRFAVGIIIGLAFSMCIILSTIGIMDGFDQTLRKALKHSVGDMYIYSSGREGFFKVDDRFKIPFTQLEISKYTSLIQSESFLIANEESRGVILRGIDAASFEQVTRLKIELQEGSVAIGEELAKQLNLKIGDDVTLTFITNEQQSNGLPRLKHFQISQIVTHGIYQKDLRLVYLLKSELQNILGIQELVNMMALDLPPILDPKKINETEYISSFQKELKIQLGSGFLVKPFWSEFSSLIEAVQVEKKAISLILQTVVVIAIFNVLAFVIFLNERHSRSLFLFKALGLSQNALQRIWYFLISLVWILACGVAFLFVQLVDFALQHLSVLHLPADIYYLGKLQLSLNVQDYLLVFISTYFWLILVTWLGLRKMKKRSILQGLRKEFA